MGRVKTRLSRGAGAVWATRFARISASAVLGRLGCSTRWQTLLAVAPDATRASRCWPGHLARHPQGPGDLGARMQRIMNMPRSGPVVIVGGDIPSIRPAHIAAAFHALGSHDAVFGPAEDGGYWLVGMRRTPRVLDGFSRVRWSTPDALADTLAHFAGKRAGLVATLRDVDDPVSLTTVQSWCGRRVLPLETT